MSVNASLGGFMVSTCMVSVARSLICSIPGLLIDILSFCCCSSASTRGYWARLLLGFLGQIQARYSIVILWIKYLINAVYMALLAGIILYFGLDFDSSKLSIFFWQL